MVYIARRLSYVDAETGEPATIPEAALIAWPAPVVILGEPGMGKSRMLRALAGSDDRFVLVSAAAFKRRGALVAPGKILLIDGLDELPGAQEQDPVQDVLAKLYELGAPPFFLSCRAADWRAVAKTSIREDYGREPTEFRLAPFGAEDAETFLAERHGREAARGFIRQMDRQGIGEFYGNPLTLQLVDRLAGSPQGLPQDRADLFLRASDALRQEQNPERPRSPLTALSRAEALGAAGAACAALILTGGEALHLGAQGATQAGELHIGEITALPGGGALPTVVSSMIFERREGGDRVAPFHRAMAEFLAADWLAAQAATVSGRRLLALMTHEGGPPASLRGVHAWLAYFSPTLRGQVIAADPYGVLRYGDAASLSPSEARDLLAALERLSRVDPYFASENRGPHAPALTQAGLADALRAVLVSPHSAFQLKSILLAALPGSEAAPLLADDLEAIYLSAERETPQASPPDVHPGYSFHERAAAFRTLVDLRPRAHWADRFEVLLRRPGEDDRRLAVESIPKVGAEHVPPDLIARATLAHLGVLPGVSVSQRQAASYGDLFVLSRAVSDDQVGAVLDALVGLVPPVRGTEFAVRYELTGFIDQLTARALALGPVEPVRLLGWLRLFRGRPGGEREARAAIDRHLREHHALRRALQRQALIVEAPASGRQDQFWSLGQTDAALHPSIEDLLVLLTPANFPDLSLPGPRELWSQLLAAASGTGGLDPALAQAARAMAAGDCDLLAYLDQIDRPRRDVWAREDRVRNWRRQAREARHKVRVRKLFGGLAEKIAEGHWMGVGQPAEAYLNYYGDLLTEVSPRERLVDWVGEDLAGAMLAGFEAGLSRTDLPQPREVAEGYGQGSRFLTTFVLLAGAAERVMAQRNLEDLSEDVVVTLFLGTVLDAVPEQEAELLAIALKAWFVTRPLVLERAWRLIVEPQIERGDDHVTGLYRVMRLEGADAALATRLAVEWLGRYPDMPHAAEAEMLDHLAREGQWSALNDLLVQRERLGFRDEAHRLCWLAVGFFTDFAGRGAALDAAARDQRGLFWAIRERGWPTDETVRGRVVGLEQLVWLVRTFRGPFPVVERRAGTSRGDSNPWDATEFLRATIRRIGADASEAAMIALAALRDEVADDYQPVLQNACAQQQKARRDGGFSPPTLGQLTAILQDRGPTGSADLQALVLDALAIVQGRMNRDNVDQVSMFHAGGVPKAEEDCRNSLVILLRDLIGHGVDTIPEHLMPSQKRADIVFALNDLRLPVEAKGQWHPELWTAASDQLDARYVIEHRAGGLGIYLVFWFGPEAPTSRRLRSPGRGQARPQTPEALRAALIARIPEHRRGQIAVVVLDVARKASKELIPAI